jgi:hypothetical protein
MISPENAFMDFFTRLIVMVDLYDDRTGSEALV